MYYKTYGYHSFLPSAFNSGGDQKNRYDEAVGITTHSSKAHRKYIYAMLYIHRNKQVATNLRKLLKTTITKKCSEPFYPEELGCVHLQRDPSRIKRPLTRCLFLGTICIRHVQNCTQLHKKVKWLPPHPFLRF